MPTATKSKVELLNDLIKKSDDQDEIDQLQDQLIEAIREEEMAKLVADAEEKRKADEFEKQRQDAEKTKIFNVPQNPEQVKVTETDRYLGKYNLRMMKAVFKTNGAINDRVKIYSKANPEELETLMKWWCNIMDKQVTGNPEIIKAAMAEGTDALGGYLTPTEERFTVLSYIREVSLGMRLCTHVPMISDVQEIPRELTKVTVAYTAESTDATETSATFDLVTLTAKRMDAYTKVTNELLADSANPGGIAAILASQFLEAVGQKIDSTVFMGTGDPMSGVFLSTAAGNSVVFDSGSTHFSELIESNLRTAISKINSSRLAGSRWFTHRTNAWTYLYGLQDGDNRPYFVESHVQGAPNLVWGYPLELPEQSPSTSAANTGYIVFGNLAGIMIGDRLTQVSLMVDPYSFSRSHETQFLLFTRWAYAHALPELLCRIATAAS